MSKHWGKWHFYTCRIAKNKPNLSQIKECFSFKIVFHTFNNMLWKGRQPMGRANLFWSSNSIVVKKYKTTVWLITALSNNCLWHKYTKIKKALEHKDRYVLNTSHSFSLMSRILPRYQPELHWLEWWAPGVIETTRGNPHLIHGILLKEGYPPFLRKKGRLLGGIPPLGSSFSHTMLNCNVPLPN